MGRSKFILHGTYWPTAFDVATTKQIGPKLTGWFWAQLLYKLGQNSKKKELALLHSFMATVSRLLALKNSANCRLLCCMNQSRRGMGVKMEDLVSQKQENFTPLPGIELMKAWVVPYLLQLKMVTRATNIGLLFSWTVMTLESPCIGVVTINTCM